MELLKATSLDKLKYVLPILLISIGLLGSCTPSKMERSFAKDNLYAWCVVAFDSLKRSPEQRIKMLKNLGISKYAYDWRNENLDQMAEEFVLAQKEDIDIIGVWLWLNSKRDSLHGLSIYNEKVFRVLQEVGYNGQIWVSFNQNFFDGLSQEEAVEKGAKMIGILSKRASVLNCKIALYNHGDWFGEPENEIRIIEALPNEELGMIYNFHHAHEQIDDFPELVPLMLPHLWGVNLNGMRRDGPEILTIGQGDQEKRMIDILIDSGYSGQFGILGHVDEADVEDILIANLQGLQKISN